MIAGNYDYENLKPPYPALEPDEIAAFCAGEDNATTLAHEWLATQGGFDGEVCWTFAGGYPSASDSPAECVAKVKALDHLPATNGADTVLFYGDRTGGNGSYNDDTAAQAVAVFMLARGDRFFFGMQADNVLNATTAALLLSNYGLPLGNMTVSGNVISRAYEKATVALDCSDFTASFTPT